MTRIPLRWIVVSVFVLCSALNYLDRNILPALAPLIMDEFQLTREDYGKILQAFAIAYALSAPAAGLFIDRFGLNRAITGAVIFWSLAGVAAGLAASVAAFTFCRVLLAIGESAGIPASGKVMHTFLRPEERALGAGTSQLGLTLGAVAAPPLATAIAAVYGWRGAFVACGLLGFVWIPMWLWTARKAPPQELEPVEKPATATDILKHRLTWSMIAANLLAMTIYTFWNNWTTLYLTGTFGISIERANTLAPLPQIAAYVGGIAGGALSLLLMRRGRAAFPARRAACVVCAILALSTAAVPLMGAPVAATLGIALSLFATTAWSVNLYTIPLDVFGGARAAFAVSLLTSAYGLTQALVSPAIGRVADAYGFQPVCVAFSVLPLVGTGLLWTAGTPRS